MHLHEAMPDAINYTEIKMSTQPNPEGNAYGRAPQYPNTLLTEVGPGTPCGEMFRRSPNLGAASA